MSVVFKTVLESDFSDVLDMMAQFNAIDNYPFDKSISEKSLGKFIKNQDLGRIWIITSDKLVIGYVVLSFGFSFEYGGRDAFIDELFIKEDLRNKGLGKQCMDFIDLEAKKLGVNALHLEVEEGNGAASSVYLKKGFKTNNRILMTKKIK